MAILRAEEIRDMGLDEMREKRGELLAEYSKEQALLATGAAPENPGKIRALRRTIARLNTIICEEEKLKQQKQKKEEEKTEKKQKRKKGGKKEVEQ